MFQLPEQRPSFANLYEDLRVIQSRRDYEWTMSFEQCNVIHRLVESYCTYCILLHWCCFRIGAFHMQYLHTVIWLIFCNFLNLEWP